MRFPVKKDSAKVSMSADKQRTFSVVTRDYVSSHAEKKFDFDFERNQS
jgi:hypothetical protein